MDMMDSCCDRGWTTARWHAAAGGADVTNGGVRERPERLPDVHEPVPPGAAPHRALHGVGHAERIRG